MPRLPLAAVALLVALGVSACSGSRPMPEPAAPMPPTAATPPAAPMPPVAQATPAAPAPATMDTVRAGRFDNGRMFTLDDAPTEYFRDTYNFDPGPEWYERARLGALRFATYCSASFVSPTGIILTNHHCARQSVTQASVEDGVDYNADGFFARNRGDEKAIEGLFVEQLVAIEDVTARVDLAAEAAADDAARQQARAAAIEAIQTEMTDARGEGYRAQVVTLYSGGQYKAYIYRRYDDVRLVFAPETVLGYFGGDPDNFTYPRYSLDFSLFRAYGDDGQPLQPDAYFPFQPDGSDPGDLVFVMGNPGSTTRLQTVAQLEYRRDVTEPAVLDYLTSREAVFGAFVNANPTDPRTPELTDTYFSLGNGRKAYTGRVEGLRDPYVIARRRAAERQYQADLRANSAAQQRYGDIVAQIAANRAAARAASAQERSFIGLGPGSPYNGTALNRGLFVALGRTTEDALTGLEDQPTEIQIGLLAARYQDLLNNLGASDPLVQSLLGGRTPQAAAEALVAGTAFDTVEGTRAAIASGADLTADPASVAATAMLAAVRAYQAGAQASNVELTELQSNLARSRFELYGTSIPPDATFTLRIADGVVRGYDYNGTVAPPYTTFYGMYDRYYSHCASAGRGADCPWTLPQRWLDAVDRIDLSTPYNFSASADIIGGNSGSPVLDRDLNVVGIAFDGNIESLPGNYVYLDEYNRTVSLDVRAMIEVLDEVYDMDWLLPELGLDD